MRAKAGTAVPPDRNVAAGNGGKLPAWFLAAVAAARIGDGRKVERTRRATLIGAAAIGGGVASQVGKGAYTALNGLRWATSGAPAADARTPPAEPCAAA